MSDGVKEALKEQADYVKKRNKLAEKLLGEDCTLYWFPSTIAVLEDLRKLTGDTSFGKIVDRCWNAGVGTFERDYILQRVKRGQDEKESDEDSEDEEEE